MQAFLVIPLISFFILIFLASSSHVYSCVSLLFFFECRRVDKVFVYYTLEGSLWFIRKFWKEISGHFVTLLFYHPYLLQEELFLSLGTQIYSTDREKSIQRDKTFADNNKKQRSLFFISWYFLMHSSVPWCCSHSFLTSLPSDVFLWWLSFNVFLPHPSLDYLPFLQFHFSFKSPDTFLLQSLLPFLEVSDMKTGLIDCHLCWKIHSNT